MIAISLDLRTRIWAARQECETTAEVADRFQVSPAFVRRLLQRHRETGSLEPRSGPRGYKPRLTERYEELRKLTAEYPDLTAGEIRERLQLSVSVVTVWRALKALGLTFKKSRSTPPSRPGRTSRSNAKTGRRSS